MFFRPTLKTECSCDNEGCLRIIKFSSDLSDSEILKDLIVRLKWVVVEGKHYCCKKCSKAK